MVHVHQHAACILPPRRLRRRRPRDKALVVAAVRHGLLSFDEACNRYSLSAEEYCPDSVAARGATLGQRRRSFKVRVTMLILGQGVGGFFAVLDGRDRIGISDLASLPPE